MRAAQSLKWVGVLAVCAALSAQAGSLEPPVDATAPALRARTLDGRVFDLAASKGRVVLVNFWATWCAPCVAEMPSLARLRDKLGVDLVAVNFQENAARIQPFLERLGVALTVVRDHDGSLREAWRVTVFPSTFVVAPDGRIALVAVGEVDWDDPAVQSRIAKLR